jgi:hypothetical protein
LFVSKGVMSSSLWLSNDPTQSEEQSKVLERDRERRSEFFLRRSGRSGMRRWQRDAHGAKTGTVRPWVVMAVQSGGNEEQRRRSRLWTAPWAHARCGLRPGGPQIQWATQIKWASCCRGPGPVKIFFNILILFQKNMVALIWKNTKSILFDLQKFPNFAV